MDNQNITWHHAIVTKEDREQLLGQRGVTLWFTGLSQSGKSTLTTEVEKRLRKETLSKRIPYLYPGWG